jgi:fermentation-respiration switch protein FrsA (DUF1100 family)
MGTRLTIGAIVVAAIGLVGLVIAVAAQRQFLYLPSSHVEEAPRGLSSESFSFRTEDGLTLGGTFVHADGAAVATVVVFNGNAGNRGDRYHIAAEFVDAGYNTVLFDYRGYGGNPGRPSEAGLVADGRAVVTHIGGRPDVDTERIVYFGESLGTGVAVAVADTLPPAVLVLRSPYTSLPDAVGAAVGFPPIRSLIWDEFPTRSTIADMPVPVVVIAGSADATIPPAQSKAVFESAAGDKLMVVVDGAGHNDRALSSDVIGRADVLGFLARGLGAG